MTSLTDNLNLLISHNLPLAYLSVYIGTIFLGNIASFSSFWLAYQGAFGPWGVPLMVLMMIVSDVSGDISWYWMGRGLSNTGLGKFIKKRLPGNDKLEGYVGKNSTKLVFLSKFIYSTTFVIIFSVGWAKMEFRRFMKTSITAILGWIPIMVGVSYGLYSSFSLIRAKSIFHQIEIFFIFGIIAFIIMDQIISWIAKRFFAKEALEQQPPRKG